MSTDDLANGMALWQEHRPQCAEDWIAVAERWVASGETTEQSSPLFAALVLAVRQRDSRPAVDDVRAAIAEMDDKVQAQRHAAPEARQAVAIVLDALAARLGLVDDRDERTGSDG